MSRLVLIPSILKQTAIHLNHFQLLVNFPQAFSKFLHAAAILLEFPNNFCNLIRINQILQQIGLFAYYTNQPYALIKAPGFLTNQSFNCHPIWTSCLFSYLFFTKPHSITLFSVLNYSNLIQTHQCFSIYS